MWVMMSRLCRKDIKESMQVGECLYSAYIGESVESSGVMRKLESKGADEPVTKEEWDEFVKGNGTESGEQEQNQEDSGLHDQDTSQEVENNVQSSGEVDEVQSSGEVDEVQSSREEQLCKDRAKSRRDLEVCLGANGRVCKVRARPYGLVRTCTDLYGPGLPESAQLDHLRCFGIVQSPGQSQVHLNLVPASAKLKAFSHVISKPRRSFMFSQL
ncbi:hypothetical protein IGI04_042915 [Brassica rapa subsp. trilocularis]|uniref:Uncharacterized protein n=1 Tax=Brassica rapa subsp. trilocularis TaxID=1813537 RepID=A0ABQ7KH80_BRACM|nr:hypothetical protein IGI04_042915 [Brassica rapa subsp. trilocularis]